MKLSPWQFIIEYLTDKDPGNWTPPSEIGQAYGRYVGSTGSGMHSAWASPKCKKLVEVGVLLRNAHGWYQLKRSDAQDN